jgi:hypothetical protein
MTPEKPRLSTSELAHAQWRKSTRSESDQCVEIAFMDDVIAVRDSKDREGAVLCFTRSEWAAFVGGTKDGEFDLT